MDIALCLKYKGQFDFSDETGLPRKCWSTELAGVEGMGGGSCGPESFGVPDPISLLLVTCLPSDQSSSFVLRIARAALYDHIAAFPNVVGVVVVVCNLFVRTYWTESCSIPEAYHKDLHAFKRRIEPFLELITLPNQYKNSQPCSVL